MVAKNTLCLWYDGTALEAAQFYAATFPDSSVGAVHRAPGDFPSGKQGDVLTVEFTVAGVPCIGLNGGPMFKHSEAFSFQIATDDQAETDRLWNAVVQADARDAGHGELDREDIALLARREVARGAMDRADPAVRKRLRVELGGVQRGAVVPEAECVLGNHGHAPVEGFGCK